MSSNLVAKFNVNFTELFPYSLSTLAFDATDTDIEYFTAEVSFKYTMYNLALILLTILYEYYFESLQEMWEKDAEIDRDNLHDESLNIPSLHAKYFELYNTVFLLRKKAEQIKKEHPSRTV